MHKILYEAPPAPRSLNPAIPPAVERVILTAMQKDRNKRYQTAGQLAAALQATTPALTVTRTREPDTRVATPPRPGMPPPSTTRPGTSIWAYVLAGAGIVAAILIVLAVLALSQPSVQPGTSVAGTTGTVGVPGMPAP